MYLGFIIIPSDGMKPSTNCRGSYIQGLSDFPEFVEAVEDGAVPVGADVEVREALREALSTIHNRMLMKISKCFKPLQKFAQSREPSSESFM